MLRHIWCELTLFDSADLRKQAEKDIMWFLEALVQRNQDYLARNPNTPKLYKSGVKWSAPKQMEGDCQEVKILVQALGAKARDPQVHKVLDKVQDVLGGEHFCDIGVILELGEIDCDGIAAFRVAELRQAGIQARPFMTSRSRPDGGTTYHALVIWPPLGPCNYETSEDPSLLLGMYQPERKRDRDAELQKNQERLEILRRYGKAALRPQANVPSSNYDGLQLDNALDELMGMPKRGKGGRK